jgi:hypothetical protein
MRAANFPLLQWQFQKRMRVATVKELKSNLHDSRWNCQFHMGFGDRLPLLQPRTPLEFFAFTSLNIVSIDSSPQTLSLV